MPSNLVSADTLTSRKAPKYFGSRDIGQIWDVGEVLLDDRGVQFGKGRGDLAWVSERIPQ